MNLSEKDKIFLERLKKLYEEKELEIELKDLGYKYLVLKQNYGDKIENYFSMTRQGIRWRFHRLFNQIYVSAYETIYFVESNFGPSLRASALEIVKERVEMRKKPKICCFLTLPVEKQTLKIKIQKTLNCKGICPPKKSRQES